MCAHRLTTDDWGRRYCRECKNRRQRDAYRKWRAVNPYRGARGRKFTDAEADQIRTEFASGVWRTQLDAAIHYGISQSRISDLLNGKAYQPPRGRIHA